MFKIRAITGSSASLTFAGGLEKFLSSSILPFVTPLTAFYAAIKAGSALSSFASTYDLRSDAS
jgi:hypothetical protein